MLPADNSTSTKKKIIYGVVGLLTFSIQVFGTVAYFAYFWQNIINNIEAALVALFDVVSVISGVYAFIAVFFVRQKLTITFDMLSSIRRDSKCK